MVVYKPCFGSQSLQCFVDLLMPVAFVSSTETIGAAGQQHQQHHETRFRRVGSVGQEWIARFQTRLQSFTDNGYFACCRRCRMRNRLQWCSSGVIHALWCRRPAITRGRRHLRHDTWHHDEQCSKIKRHKSLYKIVGLLKWGKLSFSYYVALFTV